MKQVVFLSVDHLTNLFFFFFFFLVGYLATARMILYVHVRNWISTDFNDTIGSVSDKFFGQRVTGTLKQLSKLTYLVIQVVF
jgi:hypothetical protein